MKEKIIGIIICILLIPALIPFSVASTETIGKTITVNDDGSADYMDIQEAIDAASEGDTVYVFNGVYYENLVIDKSIVLIGENNKETIIDACGAGDVIYVTADNTKITGFTLRNNRNVWVDAGIESHHTTNCEFSGNIITHTGFGIYMWNSDADIIRGNELIDNYGFGLGFTDIANGVIEHNDVENNEVGIFLNDAHNTGVMGNNFIGNNRHLYFYGVFNNEIDGNYWDNWPGFGPKVLFGRLFTLVPIPGFIIDWNPVLEPYIFKGD